MDDIQAYDYHLPDELIAREPAAERTSARLLVLDRKAGTCRHHIIRDLPELLAPGDGLVLNNTRVLPARLYGYRQQTGGKWEGLYLGTYPDSERLWKIIGQTRGRLIAGEQIIINPIGRPSQSATENVLSLQLLEQQPDGIWSVQPLWNGKPLADSQRSRATISKILHEFGTMPLPPYIGKDVAEEQDWQRYQTTYASEPGAVAAPTAGLHFTPELLQTFQDNGIAHQFVTLHVGLGTFRPISAERLSEHVMHKEWGELKPEVAETIMNTRQSAGKLVAVGTTTVRVLETAWLSDHPPVQGWCGETDLFIRPPFEFRAVDALLTNFHLPKSTLLALVSAFAGYEFIKEAYELAVQERYRFYSYGDAMLII